LRATSVPDPKAESQLKNSQVRHHALAMMPSLYQVRAHHLLRFSFRWH
jgi:hypothetical protein